MMMMMAAMVTMAAREGEVVGGWCRAVGVQWDAERAEPVPSATRRGMPAAAAAAAAATHPRDDAALGVDAHHADDDELGLQCVAEGGSSDDGSEVSHADDP